MLLKEYFSHVAYSFLLLFVTSVAAGQGSLPLSGKVINENGAGLSGATIRLLNTGRSATSGTDGSFGFRNLLPASYTLEIAATGYAALITDVDLSKNHDTTHLFYLLTDRTQLENVTVSAQKQEERAHNLPLAITTISSRAVSELRLWNAQELTAVVPNLYSGNSGDERNVTSIRGLTTTSFDPAVATYVDGVNQFNLDTYMPQLSNIERIEVLRGPQGTLYGRNALGGVINIITKSPGNQTSGFIEVNRGNYKQQRYAAGLSLPIISNKLYFGVSGLFHKRDGYYTNEFTGTSFDRQQGYTGSYNLRYVPSDKWTFNVDVKHQRNRNRGAFPLVIGVDEAFNNPYRLSQNAAATMLDRTTNASFSLTRRGSIANITAQTSFQNNYRFYNGVLDADFSPLDAVVILNNYGKPWNQVQVFTNEFRISSPAARTSPWTWVGGTYLYHQFSPVKIATGFGKDAGALGVPDTDFSTITTSESRSRGGAVFCQATYTFKSKISLTGGLRADVERKNLKVKGEYEKSGEPPLVTTPDTSGKATYAALAPKVGVSYGWQNNGIVYAQYSKGYRAGGLTQLSSDPSQPPLYPYEPEYSHNFEVGLKQTWLQNRVRIFISAFASRVNDVQVPTLILPEAITVTANRGKLRSSGAEVELAAQPLRGLVVQYNAGVVNAHYRSLISSSYGEVVDLTGRKQIFTPDKTSFLAVQYTRPVSAKQGINLIMRGEWFHLGTQYFDPANEIRQTPYSRFNTRAGISTKAFELFFWGRNLANKAYIEYAYDFGGVHLGNPRTVGITARANF